SALSSMLSELSTDWTSVNEGGVSWSVYDIVGHLIHGEKTDWMVRLDIILSESGEKTFQPFDRFAQFEESRDKSLEQLLEEFRKLRRQNLKALHSKNIIRKDLNKAGIHPALGNVTLAQLLSTWVV